MKCDKKFKRKCISCGEFKDKQDLIKITKTSEGEIILNPTNFQHGRSVYLCKSQECLNIAIKNKRFAKMLKVQIPQKIINELYEYFRKFL